MTYQEPRKLLETADKLIHLSFYVHAFERKTPRLCCRMSECEVELSEQEAEELAERINAAIRPIIVEEAFKLANKAISLVKEAKVE